MPSNKPGYDAAYRESHREQVREDKRRWQASNASVAREQWEKHRDKDPAAYKQKAKERHVRREYGLGPEEYRALIVNGCESCGSHEKMCVDHDHETGEVRGALCHKCNVALGMLGDSRDGILDLLNYLGSR